MIKKTLHFVLGMLIGMAIVFGYFSVINRFNISTEIPNDAVVAKVGDLRLTESQAEILAGHKMGPASDYRQRMLAEQAEAWVDEQVLKAEAKEKGLSPEAFLAQEIVSKVLITPEMIAADFNQHGAVYGVSLQEASALITKKLQEQETEKVKKAFLQPLRSKHQAAVLIQRPEVKNPLLDLAAIPSGGLNAPAPEALQIAPPLEKPMQKQAPLIRVANFTVEDLAGKPSQGPEQAPITLVEFSDFHCPYCQKSKPIIEALIQNNPGKIRRIWWHYPLPMHEQAPRVHAASECALAQGKFWEFHDAVFQNIDQSKQETGVFEIAKKVGLNEASFKQCLEDPKTKEKVDTIVNRGRMYGVQGTPSTFLNGREVGGARPVENFQAVVDYLMDPVKYSAPAFLYPQPETAQEPEPIKPIQFSAEDLKGRPSMGPEDAAVTLVEFSDFHCPFCARLSPTLDQLVKNHEGRIRRVWWHSPLPMHPNASQAHAASECANEQGKFWEYHSLIFQDISKSQDDAGLLSLAEKLGLNQEQFKSCLGSETVKTLIQESVKKAQSFGVDGTPSSYINGKPVVGAQPLESFEKAVQEAFGQQN